MSYLSNGHLSSRRQFVAAVATCTPALPLASLAAEENKINPIDAHVHVWTPDTNTYPLAPGYDVSAMQPPSFTPQELFAHCKPLGVQRIVLIQMSFYGFDNRYMLDVMRQKPEVFRGVAIIDHTQAEVAGTMRSMAEQGVRGFRLYATAEKASTWATSDGMTRMWQAAAEQNLAMCLLADPEALPSIKGMCRRFPNTPVVIDHFARLGLKGRVNSGQLDQLLALAEFDKVHVKTSAFYALGAKQPPYEDLAPMIRSLRDAFGAERLMWASDCPYQVQNEHTYLASLALIRDKLEFLSSEEKRSMLETTAKRLFFG